MKRYVVGIDFGTLSARAIVLDVIESRIVSEYSSSYKHGVMDECLPNGVKLPDNFALQHPIDYLEALEDSVKNAVSLSGASSDEIGGIGVDFTASTVVPIHSDGRPLAFDDEFSGDPHAYVKLWKHHGAQKEADDFTRVAKEMDEKWLSYYGGAVSSELMFPKILETARYSKKVYDATDRFIDAGDWINFILTGKETHCVAFAGFKAFWNELTGYPSNDYFISVDPLLDGIIGTKVSNNISPITGSAGVLCEKGAELTGLDVGTPVSLAMLDAHASMPALNITGNSNLMLILGTSACHIVNSDKNLVIDGLFGCVKGGVVPGVTTYEAGQACFGDAFDWFVNNMVPAAYYNKAAEQGIGIHSLLESKASELKINENKLIALDWFNGNRSVLNNSRLSGMMLGLTINTKPEEIYRALLEAAAFGTKRIVDQFDDYGVIINKVTASGGIANKNSLLMQIIADVLNKEVFVCSATQSAALGSAIYASVAGGFFDNIVSASKALSAPCEKNYKPIKDNVVAYSKLYSEYLRLHNYFGKENLVMERL